MTQQITMHGGNDGTVHLLILDLFMFMCYAWMIVCTTPRACFHTFYRARARMRLMPGREYINRVCVCEIDNEDVSDR